MPVHDWTLVDDNVFHAFHVAWVPEIMRALNAGLLPPGYYALAEQHAGDVIADVLTLHATPADRPPPPPLPPPTGGTLLAEAPPRVHRRQVIEPGSAARRRSLAVRHTSGHRLVALLEIVPPASKDRGRHVEAFAAKVADALHAGVHVLVVDLLPPGRHDRRGMHAAIRRRIAQAQRPRSADAPPPGEPVTLAAYTAGPHVEAYVGYAAVGAPLPEMPLFLRPDRYVNVPLEQTYQDAYRGMPQFWRDVLEGRPPQAP